MSGPIKIPPAYAVRSVDHALRLATMLQLEGALTVSEAADRLQVARSTAHRLLSMLVYRDFAVQNDDLAYRAGPVLELAVHSGSDVARLRSASLPHLARLVEVLQESANVAVLVGRTVRFVASVESPQSLRVGSREGMVFAAHETTAGLLLLADLGEDHLTELYGSGSGAGVDLEVVRADVALAMRQGFALNQDRSERGVTALGVGVRGPGGSLVAGLSVSLPSARFEPTRMEAMLAVMRQCAAGVRADLVASRSSGPAAQSMTRSLNHESVT